MKNATEREMKIQITPSTNQDEQCATPLKDSNEAVSKIRQERNRLLRSVTQQPTEVLRDIASLAIGWAMHELEVRFAGAKNDQTPFDFVAWLYCYRIVGLADGNYGTGMMASVTDGVPQRFDTSTCTLVAQLREEAQIGAGQ